MEGGSSQWHSQAGQGEGLAAGLWPEGCRYSKREVIGIRTSAPALGRGLPAWPQFPPVLR